jgi:virulence-associated protein VapD
MEHNDEDTKMLQGVWSGATTVGCTADAWNIMMKIQKFVRCIVQKVAIFNIEQWVMP